MENENQPIHKTIGSLCQPGAGVCTFAMFSNWLGLYAMGSECPVSDIPKLKAVFSERYSKIKGGQDQDLGALDVLFAVAFEKLSEQQRAAEAEQERSAKQKRPED